MNRGAGVSLLLDMRLLLLLVLVSPWLQAQDRETAPPDSTQGRTVVTATRTPKNPLEVPRGVETLDAEELRRLRQVRTLPEALKENPGVSVQKTGHAQGSPKFRGLTGFHTLLLVDGIRLNNSTWRSGNVEYWNTVDAYSIDRIEIVRGPSSVLYGSDAVAGTAQVFSRGPGALEPGLRASHGALFRFSSAEQSYVERVETRGNADAFGWHAGLSYKDFSELVGGKTIGEMPYTGYRQLDADMKLAFSTEDAGLFSLGFQHANPMDGPRTHSTVFAKPWRGTTPGSDFLREIDQLRDLAFLKWQPLSGEEQLDFTFSYQRFDEEENRVRANSRRRIQGTEVDQWGIQGQLGLDFEDLVVTAGFDFYHEDVDSHAVEFNPDGSLRVVRPRGPVADDASYDQLGLYAQAELPIDAAWHASLGARYSYVEADADQVDPDPTDAVPFAPVRRSWNSLVGSASLLYRALEPLSLFAHVAQSFRAPNLSDLTRFDVALSGDLEIPSTLLDPERFLTFELGGRYDDGLRRAAVTGFYTIVNDLIQRAPTGNIVGGNTEVTKANVGDGFFVGFEAEAATRLEFLRLFGTDLDAFELYAFGDLVHSVIDAADPADGSRTHPKGLPPPKGQVGLRWRDLVDDRFSFEVFVPFAAGIDGADYNAAERRNTERIPPDGLPGYALLGVRGSARLGAGLTASLAIENVTNRDYRIFDSGLNEPGTNVILTLQAGF